MSNEKFTPGEWTVAYNGNIVFVVIKGTEKENIPDIVCSAGLNNEYHRANAALITAAPELYKELQRECVICRLKGHETACDFCRIGKVLKKARGEE